MKFRLVDRIVGWEKARWIRGVKAVSFEEYMLKSPFGEEVSLPATLLLESLFQLGNWLVILSSDFRQMGVVVRIEEVRFDGLLRPGERLDMEATIRRWRDDGILFDGAAFAAGRRIAAGKGCLASPVELAAFHDPEDLKVLFAEIARKTG